MCLEKLENLELVKMLKSLLNLPKNFIIILKIKEKEGTIVVPKIKLILIIKNFIKIYYTANFLMHF